MAPLRYSGPCGVRAQSDEDFLDHIRQTAGTTYNPTSTCMMGQHERAVVDTELRVRGVETHVIFAHRFTSLERL